jgi:hypothetical protein
VTIRSTESVSIAAVSATQSLFATSQPSPDASTRSTPIERVISRCGLASVQAVLRMIVGHRGQLLVLGPLALQGPYDLALGLGVDDVDAHRVRLLEALDAVDGLDEVVELEADADEDRPVAVPLEVAAGPAQRRLGGEQPRAALGEVDDPLLANLQVQRPVHLDHLGERPLDRAAFVLQVVPQDEVVIGRGVDDLGGLRYPGVHRVALLPGRVPDTERGAPEQMGLSVAVDRVWSWSTSTSW